MPDFIRLTAYEGHKVVVVTAAIGAVGSTGLTAEVMVQGVWLPVRESVEHVLGLMGVPTNRMVFDERDRPFHELTDDELILAWRQWNESKNIHSLGSAAMLEAELRRRCLVVGRARE